jgi:hypothetical protein
MMKRIDLEKIPHNCKTGGNPTGEMKPNIFGDCIFYEDNKPIGFYIENISGKLKKYIDIANAEFRSKDVPKSTMKRSSSLRGEDSVVEQYSTILGGVPPKPHMRRDYPTISSVHSKKSARTFVKAMMLACKESEQIIKEIMPEQYDFQKQAILDNVPKEYRFGDLFTSSISNYNIPAPYHTDKANIKGCVNVIITKKYAAEGGDLHVPDYGAVMNSKENSMLVYPAWKNMHGVTPIIPHKEGGYRNSLVFYPLASFKKYV